MDSLEMNKIAAAALTAGVVAMLSGFISTIVVHAPDAPTERAYAIAIPEAAAATDTAATAEPVQESILPLLASADSAAGEKVAKKCAACHTFDEGGPNRVGPNLYGIVGRQVAATDGFSYSDALAGKSSETWSYEHLDAFLTKPKDWAPGTKMAYAGLRKTGDRADLIAYLRGLSGSPMAMPSVEEPAAEATETAAETLPAASGAAETASETAADAAEAVAEAAEAAQEALTQASEAAPATAGGGLGTQIAAADTAAGTKVFRKCKACHTVDKGGKKRIGPNLYGIVGQPVAGVEGFSYSDALKGKADEVWSYENLAAFLAKPKEWAPGTKMTFPGLRKEGDIAALLAYLREQHDNPPALPE